MEIEKQETVAHKSLTSHLSGNLRHLRRKLKLSQEELACRLGLNRGNIASYENGSAEPKICNLIKIAHFFQVSLFDLTQYNISESNDGSSALLRLQGLAPNERAKLDQLFQRSEDFNSFLQGLHSCYQYNAKSLQSGEELPKEAQIIMSYFEQLYEATARLAEEHRMVLDICRCGEKRQ